jgi:hypothetical protein
MGLKPKHRHHKIDSHLLGLVGGPALRGPHTLNLDDPSLAFACGNCRVLPA